MVNQNWKLELEKLSYFQFLDIQNQNKPKLISENLNIFGLLTLDSDIGWIYFRV